MSSTHVGPTLQKLVDVMHSESDDWASLAPALRMHCEEVFLFMYPSMFQTWYGFQAGIHRVLTSLVATDMPKTLEY